MNRLEFLLIALALFVGAVLFLRSKKFDAFISKLMRGTETKTVSELETDIKHVEKSRVEIHEELLNQEENIKSVKRKLNKL